MAKSFADLVAELKGSREGVHPSIQTFPPLDLGQTARELRIDERAAEAGQRNTPPADGEQEDATELDIRAEIERRARKASEDYRSSKELYESRIRRALISANQRIAVEAAGKNALADFGVQARDELNHLHLDRDELDEREKEFNNFRRKHELERLPNDPSSLHRKLGVLLLVLFFLFESILNGIFFAQGSEGGLIGGVTQALGLSFLNIGAAILYAGLFFRLILHRRWAIKVVGIGASAIYLGWALFINLLIAHFRDLFIASQGRVEMQRLLTDLFETPFQLADPNSWLLAALGLVLSLVAVIDVVGLNDVYPGFGAVGRRRAQATRAYAGAQNRCLRALQGTRDGAVSGMIDFVDEMKGAEFELRICIDNRGNLHRNYCAYLDHLADGYARLSQQYREVNSKARQDTGVPRFRKPPQRPEFLTAGPLEELAELRQDERAKVLERMEYFIEAVNRRYEEVVEQFDTVVRVTERKEPRHAAA